MTMRLASKARDKAALPEGYQFGDARLLGIHEPVPCACRPPSRLCKHHYDALTGMGWKATGWNVIEGEHFTSDVERHPVRIGSTPLTRMYDHDFSRDRVDGRADRPSLTGGDREPVSFFGQEAELRRLYDLYVRPAFDYLKARIHDGKRD